MFRQAFKGTAGSVDLEVAGGTGARVRGKWDVRVIVLRHKHQINYQIKTNSTKPENRYYLGTWAQGVFILESREIMQAFSMTVKTKAYNGQDCFLSTLKLNLTKYLKNCKQTSKPCCFSIYANRTHQRPFVRHTNISSHPVI